MLLTSCSSGGSSTSIIGGGDTGDDTGGLTTAQFLRGGIATADTAQLRTALRTTAGNTPTSGSVSQAPTDSEVSVTIPITNSTGNQFDYGWTLVTGGESRTLRYDEEALNASNSLGVFRNIALDDVISDGDSREYYVSIFTDHEGGEDADYLAGGFWLYVPEDEAGAVSFGAFADGNSPFSIVPFLDGGTSAAAATMAIFSGKATGICDCASARDATPAPRVFEADAALTLTFGSSDVISGTISDFIVDETSLGDTSPTIFLKSVDLAGSNSSSGFFTGDTSVVSGTGADAGKWGGEFYGSSSNALPGSVGGTFGATMTVETVTSTYVGAFGAHRQ